MLDAERRSGLEVFLMYEVTALRIGNFPRLIARSSLSFPSTTSSHQLHTMSLFASYIDLSQPSLYIAIASIIFVRSSPSLSSSIAVLHRLQPLAQQQRPLTL